MSSDRHNAVQLSIFVVALVGFVEFSGVFDGFGHESLFVGVLEIIEVELFPSAEKGSFGFGAGIGVLIDVILGEGTDD